jgi:hypothetical protein
MYKLGNIEFTSYTHSFFLFTCHDESLAIKTNLIYVDVYGCRILAEKHLRETYSLSLYI